MMKTYFNKISLSANLNFWDYEFSQNNACVLCLTPSNYAFEMHLDNTWDARAAILKPGTLLLRRFALLNSQFFMVNQ